MYAHPMAASAMAEITPPCTVPMGLVWDFVTGKVTTASPSANEVRAKPTRSAAAGAGISLRSNACMPSIILAIRGSPAASDVRDDRGGLLGERPLEGGRQRRVVLVAGRKDPALGDLARKVLQDLRERFLGHP